MSIDMLILPPPGPRREAHLTAWRKQMLFQIEARLRQAYPSWPWRLGIEQGQVWADVPDLGRIEVRIQTYVAYWNVYGGVGFAFFLRLGEEPLTSTDREEKVLAAIGGFQQRVQQAHQRAAQSERRSRYFASLPGWIRKLYPSDSLEPPPSLPPLLR